MEYYTIFLTLLSIIITFITYYYFFSKKNTELKSPPGPKPWPIIGHIHLLGNLPHRSLTTLSKIYGPIMSLNIGSVKTIVISSPSLAQELFLKHDLTFSTRHVPDALTASDHDKLSLTFTPLGHKWRVLRKITVTQLFSNQRLDATQSLRRNKVDELIEFATQCCKNGQAMEISKAAFTTSLNLLSNTFFSMDLCSYDKFDRREFIHLIRNFMDLAVKPNVSDLFPVLRPFDLQGIKRMSKGYVLRLRGYFEEIIEERSKDPLGSKNDVLATLLKLVQEEELSLDEVKHILLDLFIAGTDTTSVTIEWTMTELLRHPHIMEKAQEELNQVIDKEKSVQESDISKLPYLQAIVKETLRLHPAGPFLLPRKPLEDAQLNNYYVPKQAQVLVNIWTICRDPTIWDDPESFKPERFLQSNIDLKGQHYELLVFGAGRRICPGMPLAYRMLHLMLANLLHSFIWKLPKGMDKNDIDLNEKFRITLTKLEPLQTIPYPK